ncbi:MAG: PEGA domain-containing protein [Candidatus Omnitrophica bacterium]|nr:PEGA domain-containing protein [Candidatus Omnitrophota bacterium]
MAKVKKKSQILRAALFYCSVCIFCAGLPFILAYALGYYFDTRAFRFIRTGIVALKSFPDGADVYLNGRRLEDKTPLTLNELLPGSYSVRVELPGYVPWEAVITLDSGKVERYEKIILFPARPDISHLNKAPVTAFYLDSDRGVLYYFHPGPDGGLYRSQADGSNFEKAGVLPDMQPRPLGYRLSPERKRVAYFNRSQIIVSALAEKPARESGNSPLPLAWTLRKRRLLDIFWFSNAQYLVLLTSEDIAVLELRPQAEPVSLVALNKPEADAFYDAHSDTLYFQDAQRAPDGRMYENVYQLRLNPKHFDDMVSKILRPASEDNNEN